MYVCIYTYIMCIHYVYVCGPENRTGQGILAGVADVGVSLVEVRDNAAVAVVELTATYYYY